MRVERAVDISLSSGFSMVVVELDAKMIPKGFEEGQCNSNLLGTS